MVFTNYAHSNYPGTGNGVAWSQPHAGYVAPSVPIHVPGGAAHQHQVPNNTQQPHSTQSYIPYGPQYSEHTHGNVHGIGVAPTGCDQTTAYACSSETLYPHSSPYAIATLPSASYAPTQHYMEQPVTCYRQSEPDLPPLPPDEPDLPPLPPTEEPALPPLPAERPGIAQSTHHSAESRSKDQYQQTGVSEHPIPGYPGSSFFASTSMALPGNSFFASSPTALPSTQHWTAYPSSTRPPAVLQGQMVDGYSTCWNQQAYNSQGYQSQTYPAQLPQGQPSNGWVSSVQAYYSTYPNWSQTQIQQSSGIVSSAPQQKEERKPMVVKAATLFHSPDRSTRPKKIVIILRGLPGSGKSYLAKLLRDTELKHGGETPRILSIDDYFMTEVDKEVVEDENGKRGKRKTVTMLEYMYESAMEEAYKKSLIKSFQRTVEDGKFKMVIMDADNIAVEDFRECWSAGQAAGYEVYVLKPFEDSVEVCYTRNQHQRSLTDIQALANKWEEPPIAYTQLDVSSLLSPGSVSKGPGGAIQEVDMEAVDGSAEEAAVGQDGSFVVKTKWSTPEDELLPVKRKAESKSKKQKKAAQAQYDGLTDGLDSLVTKTQWELEQSVGGTVLTKKLKSALAKPGRNKTRRVQWADEVEAPVGFRIGDSAFKLEHVFLVEGLGPPKDESFGEHRSFAEQVSSERKAEQHAFKDILLGRRVTPKQYTDA